MTPNDPEMEFPEYSGDELDGCLLMEMAREATEARKQLEHAQQLLQDFLHYNPALTFIKDEEGRYIYASKSFLDYFKVTAEDCIGKTDFEWLPEELARRFTDNDNKVRATGEVLVTVETFSYPHDEPHSNLVHKFPIKGPDDKAYVGGIKVDISQRLKAESLSARLAAIVSSSHDAIIGTTMDGIIDTWNESAERIFGYLSDEIVGKSFKTLFPKDRAGEIDEMFEALKRGEHTDQYESPMLRRGNREIHGSVTVSPIRDTADGIIGASVIARDTTRRKEMEDQLRQTTEQLAIARDEALEASNLKSAFVANISHELRTPLSAILGMAELLTLSELTAEQRDLVTILQASAQSLLTIVNDILDLSKIEAGRLTLELQPFNLLFLVQECARSLAPSVKDKRLYLKTNVDHRIPEFVIGDSDRIRQTLLNLMTNSIKFTDKGGIDVEVVIEQEEDDLIFVKFSVQDTGIGISEDERRLLFKPFTQVDGSATRKYSGTGLGLSISKRLVELMGGQIGLASEKGRGTTLWFIVPFKRAEHQAPGPSGETASTTLPSEFSGRTILVVEDNSVLQKLLLKQLSNVGIQAHGVSTGLEAIDAVKGLNFDLIFMDCQLPELDGFETARQIRKWESQSGKHTPIVALTAGAMKGDREKCLDAGMDDYLSKPASIQQILDMIKIWVPVKESR